MKRRAFLKRGLLFTAAPMLWLPRKALANPLVLLSGSPPPAGTTFTGAIAQRFEGTGYDNGEAWTASEAGTTDPDYTGLVLAGSQSCRFITSSQLAITTSPNFTSSTEVWGCIRWRPVTVQALNRIFLRLRGGTAGLSEIRRNSDGTLRITNGAASVSTVGTTAAGTTYHVWFRWLKQVTSGDGISEVAFSTDGVRPTSGNNFASLSTGTSNVNADNVQIGLLTSGIEESVIDNVFISLAGHVSDNPI